MGVLHAGGTPVPGGRSSPREVSLILLVGAGLGASRRCFCSLPGGPGVSRVSPCRQRWVCSTRCIHDPGGSGKWRLRPPPELPAGGVGCGQECSLLVGAGSAPAGRLGWTQGLVLGATGRRSRFRVLVPTHH